MQRFSPPPGPVSEHALRRQKFRRYRWFRHHNRDSDDPKWGVVAAAAGASVAEVIATQNKLQEVANDGHPRGSIDEFEPVEWAFTLGVDRDVIDRIVVQLEAVLWIDQDRIPAFELRNPDSDCETTSTERVRAHRAKKKAAKEAAKEAAFLAKIGGGVKHVSPVSSVSETTRAEQTINQDRRLPLGPVALRGGLK